MIDPTSPIMVSAALRSPHAGHEVVFGEHSTRCLTCVQGLTALEGWMLYSRNQEQTIRDMQDSRDRAKSVIAELEVRLERFQDEAARLKVQLVQKELDEKKEIDLDGRVDQVSGVTYIGSARLEISRRWTCMANVNGCLCWVEVRITPDFSSTRDQFAAKPPKG